MPSAFSRLRLWLGISALLMITLVAGFYFYARYRVHKALHDLPAKLGVNIQQNTEGFTYSQSAGGHTIFSISASNAVRYKQGGKAELHKVKIVSYGRNSDRLDEISGDDFEYDAQSGDVAAKGQVAIALQAVQPGTSSPNGDAKKIGSPVHLETSGLVFNQKTGIAKTADKITFALPQGSGSAIGATYDSGKNSLDLHSGIHLVTGGPKPVDLQAASGLFQQDTQELTLTDLRAESGVRHMEAEHVVVHLRNDNTVERAEVGGGVKARVQGNRAAQVHASTADFVFGSQNHVSSGRLGGGVTWETSGATASHGNAGQVLLAFGSDNQLASVRLRENVDLVQLTGGSQIDAPSGAKARRIDSLNGTAKAVPLPKADRARADTEVPRPGFDANFNPRPKTQPRAAVPPEALPLESQEATAQEDMAAGNEFRGDGLDLRISGGKRLQTANSVGAAQILLRTAQNAEADSKGKTLITASRFDAKFSADNQLSTLTGSAPVRIVASAPGQPDRVSESHDLLATFAGGKSQTLKDVIQTGDVQIREGERGATADRATFNQNGDSLTLSGNVRYKDASTGATLTSDALALNRAKGETTAAGDVKTTYAEKKGQSSGGMLSPSEAVHVTAPQMVVKNSGGTAQYSGGARLWQGGNIVQSPILEFNRNNRTLDARAQGGARVSTVFVQPDKNGKDRPVEVAADHLRYDDNSRRAVFEGSVVVRGADSTLRTNKTVVTLKPQTQRTRNPKMLGSGAPSEVQTIEATGDVQLEQAGRRASGARLIYNASEGKFVLTGTPGAPPSIFDAEHGQVTGVSLTFFNHDDRVLVDSSNSTSITQSRLKK